MHEELNAVCRFAEAAIKTLRERATADPVPQQYQPKIVFGAGGSWAYECYTKQDFWPWVYKHGIEALLDLPDGIEATKLLVEQRMIEMPPLSDASVKGIVSPTLKQQATVVIPELLNILSACLEGEKLERFDQARFTLLYGRLCDVWSVPAESVIVVPLLGLDGEIEETLLPNGYRLTKFTEEIKNILFSNMDSFGSGGAYEWARCQYCLLFRKPMKARWNATLLPDSSAIGTTFAIITALRLLHTGGVGTLGHFAFNDPFVLHPTLIAFFSHDSTLLPPRKTRDRFNSDSYVLTAEDMVGLSSLLNNFFIETAQERLSTMWLAMMRFNMACTRCMDEDRVIDLTVALESTLLGDMREELSYRLSLRGAALLADEAVPEATIATSRTIYKLRSKLVHAGKRLADAGNGQGQLDGIPVRDIPRKAEELVRRVLVTLLHQIASGCSLEEILETLDSRIACGLSRRIDR